MGTYENICDFSHWVRLIVDAEAFNSLQGRLNAACGTDDSAVRWAQDRILRASAFESGAVEDLYAEGATYSVAMEVEGWKNDLSGSGDGAAQHFEDQLAAYVAVRELATQSADHPLLEVEIRELHRIATRSQATHPVQTQGGVQQHKFTPGQYKNITNQAVSRSGRIIQYSPVEDVVPEMEVLISSMRTEDYAGAHPIIQAAYIHWAIAHIHPFSDGNGRMARVIGSIPLLANYGIPLVIFAGRKKLYLQALEAADRHNHQDMVTYLADRTMETYSWLCELIEGANASAAANSSLKDIDALLANHSDSIETSREATERVASTVFSTLQQEAERQFVDTPLKYDVASGSGSFRMIQYPIDILQNYEIMEREVKITLSIDELVQHSTEINIYFGFSDSPPNAPIIVLLDSSKDKLQFSLEDCSPDLSVGAELRLRNLASTVVAYATQKFSSDLAGIFKQHGRLP